MILRSIFEAGIQIAEPFDFHLVAQGGSVHARLDPPLEGPSDGRPRNGLVIVESQLEDESIEAALLERGSEAPIQAGSDELRAFGDRT